MPKFILATVALFLGRQGPSGADAHDAMHARTRSRDATRRVACGRPARTIRISISAPWG